MPSPCPTIKDGSALLKPPFSRWEHSSVLRGTLNVSFPQAVSDDDGVRPQRLAPTAHDSGLIYRGYTQKVAYIPLGGNKSQKPTLSLYSQAPVQKDRTFGSGSSSRRYPAEFRKPQGAYGCRDQRESEWAAMGRVSSLPGVCTPKWAVTWGFAPP